MPGREEMQKGIADRRDALLAAIIQSKERAEIGRANEKKLAEFRKEQRFYETKSRDIKEAVNYMSREYKNIESYLVNKKAYSMEMLKLAIEKAGLVVPDADTTGIHLSIGDNSARIVNDKGQDVNMREGSAFRTVMGKLMQYTLLMAQPDCLQFILLDEAFATLSDSTAAAMREYLNSFKDDILIIGIEQRNYLYEGIDRTVYEVVKDEEGASRVRRQD